MNEERFIFSYILEKFYKFKDKKKFLKDFKNKNMEGILRDENYIIMFFISYISC